MGLAACLEVLTSFQPTGRRSDLVVDHWASAVESSSPLDFLSLHAVWTLLGRLIGYKIMSILSVGCDFTTKSGGICRILRNQIKGRVRLSDGERKTLAEIGSKLGKHALEEVAKIVKPDTILGWHRTLVAQKFDGSTQRKAPGRPTIDPELEALVVRMAHENRSWGDDRIVGALANLGYTVRDQTVGNILKRHGLPPAPERKKTTTWKEFIRTHMEVLVATDFFTAEVWTLGGAGDILRLILRPSGEPEGRDRGNDTASQ